MKVRPLMVRCAAALLLPALAWAWMPFTFAADEKPAAKEKADSPEAKAKKQPADYRGPLPFYYAKVVSPDQKTKIYAVQESYDAKMKPLLAQLRELEEARDKDIDAILTAEQLKRIDELKAEARAEMAKRKEGDGDKKPAAEKPADKKAE